MVFQNYALYPHMTVAQNIGFGLKLRKASKKEQQDAVNRAAEMLQLTELLDRRPRQLSGGQRQRVAMGRAIVRNPAVFLMDEPLSNLDAKLRTQMRVEIRQLQRHLTTTTIFVTHDQVEAMTLADQIAVINEGRLQQYGTPDDLYTKPVNRFVAGFIGSPPMNFLKAQKVADREVELLNGIRLKLPAQRAATLAGTLELEIGIRPEHIEVVVDSDKNVGDRMVWSGSVNFSEILGGETIIHTAIGDQKIKVKLPEHKGPVEGSTVQFAFKPSHVHIIRSDTNANVSPATET